MKKAPRRAAGIHLQHQSLPGNRAALAERSVNSPPSPPTAAHRLCVRNEHIGQQTTGPSSQDRQSELISSRYRLYDLQIVFVRNEH